MYGETEIPKASLLGRAKLSKNNTPYSRVERLFLLKESSKFVEQRRFHCIYAQRKRDFSASGFLPSPSPSWPRNKSTSFAARPTPTTCYTTASREFQRRADARAAYGSGRAPRWYTVGRGGTRPGCCLARRDGDSR